MAEIAIEQAVFHGDDGRNYFETARSPGFRDEWSAAAEAICAGFGPRPEGAVCTGAIFACPIGKGHVAVVHAADLRPNVLGFHFLVLRRDDYDFLGGDPFDLADRFTPAWNATRPLESAAVPALPPQRRSVDDVRAVLKRPDGPSLLGGAQALIDGARLVFERSEPADDEIRSLWMLLPYRERAELWPASFAFSNDLGFHLLAVPQSSGPEFAGYLQEDQAGDYPEGKYELNLQLAAESGNQGDLDALFLRRSPRQTWRLGLAILIIMIFVVIASRVLRDVFLPGPPPRPAPAANPAEEAR